VRVIRKRTSVTALVKWFALLSSFRVPASYNFSINSNNQHQNFHFYHCTIPTALSISNNPYTSPSSSPNPHPTGTMTMYLKRKRSNSDISTTSSMLTSPHHNSNSMAIDSSAIASPSLLSSRTRKRHRDNRPNEEIVHRMLYFAINCPIS
jgi:hypothetical protein